MIQPVNGHILIEPIVHDDFVMRTDDKYQEIGVVVAYDPEVTHEISVGDKVYFDAWLAKKYPKAGGKPDEFLWLVKWEHISAVE